MEYWVHLDNEPRKRTTSIVDARRIAIKDLMKHSNLQNRPIYTSRYGKGHAGNVFIKNGDFYYSKRTQNGIRYYALTFNGEIKR